MSSPILTPGSADPPAEPKAIAKVEFLLLNNGQVMAQAGGPNRIVIRGLIDAGIDLLKDHWLEQDAKKAEGPGIEVAPASFLDANGD